MTVPSEGRRSIHRGSEDRGRTWAAVVVLMEVSLGLVDVLWKLMNCLMISSSTRMQHEL
jgi:hypothetical protein